MQSVRSGSWQSTSSPTAGVTRPIAKCNSSSHDQVATALGTEILQGVHRPGTRIPSESDLIERFKVSRTVMREVMKTLSGKGLVVSKSRVGTRVRDPTSWNFFDADVLAWRARAGIDETFLESLREVRYALEPAAAALVAQRRTATDILRLREHVRQMGRSGHTRQSFAEADLKFHLAIGAISGNPLMRSVANVIQTALAASCSVSSAVDDPSDHEINVNSHAAIVDAIEARDQVAAARGMLRVIDIGVRRIARKKRGQRRNPTNQS